MKKSFGKTAAILILCLCAATTAMADIKLKVKTGIAGRTTESATYIKGKRQRASQNFGGGIEMVMLTQCDLNRTVQLNDSAKTYMVTAMGGESSGGAAPANRPPARESEPARTRKGGVVTYTTNMTDTGERKKMFGFTARHITTSMSVESSPYACNPSKVRIETDGWYIDLEFAFNCDLERPMVPSMPQRAKPECQDEMRFRRSGSAKLGYPVMVTTTIYNDGGQTTTMTTEVIELETATLDQSLFEVPAGYTEAKSYQELMGMPSMDSLRRGRPMPDRAAEMAAPVAGAKRPGVIRVGVVSVVNKTDRSPSLGSLSNQLVGSISDANVDAVPLDGHSPAEIEAEAKQKGCDYVLYTDVSQLKTSGSKVGGLIGRASGVGGLKEKFEARLDFKLFPLGSSAPQLSSSASAKEEGSDDVSLSAAAGKEARAVVSEVRKRK